MNQRDVVLRGGRFLVIAQTLAGTPAWVCPSAYRIHFQRDPLLISNYLDD